MEKLSGMFIRRSRFFFHPGSRIQGPKKAATLFSRQDFVEYSYRNFWQYSYSCIFRDEESETFYDEHYFRKQELRELKLLQKQEQKQFQVRILLFRCSKVKVVLLYTPLQLLCLSREVLPLLFLKVSINLCKSMTPLMKLWLLPVEKVKRLHSAGFHIALVFSLQNRQCFASSMSGQLFICCNWMRKHLKLWNAMPQKDFRCKSTPLWVDFS